MERRQKNLAATPLQLPSARFGDKPAEKKCGVAMTRKREGRGEPAQEPAQALPPDLILLLEEIEKEPVPQKLLALAVQLQEALAEKRRRDAAAKAARARAPARERVRQPQ
ncbi:hypothetical protein [Chelativorans sp.]|uniref:hypothetical protein n=1 Tax=Chelativorans sp. TaxID=2203393 RepID=UPI002811581B|nr:hypothetical protein [Chelativorans sp.]